MPFPNFPNKHQEKSLVTPEIFTEYRKEIGRYPEYTPPRGIIFCYQPRLLDYIVKNYAVTKVEGIGGNLHLLKDTNNQIGVCGKFGIGAPVVAILMEELIAFGVKRFLSIGIAGSLQKNLHLGSIVVCDKAIRDEGTSHHYLKSEKYVPSSKAMKERIECTIEKMGLKYITGTTWTIDAPYRETTAEVTQYRKEGVLTVEMEAAALFAVAICRKVEIGAIFTISDYLEKTEWKPHFHLTEKHEKELFTIAKEVLAAE